MPTIQENDPFGAGVAAAAGYTDQKRQNDELARQAALQNAEMQRQASRDKRADFESDRTYTQKQAEDAESARVDAANTLHQARADALAAAKEKEQETKDKRTYDLDVRKINQTHADAMAKIQGTKDVARIHAAATLGAASIHAAATVQAAGINAASRIQAAGIRASNSGGGEGLFGPQTKGEAEDTNAEAVKAQLPQALQSLLDQVGSGQTNPTMVRLYVAAHPQFKHYAPVIDALLTRKNVVPRATAGDARATAAEDAEARNEPTPEQRMSAKLQFRLISKAKGFKNLPPRLQAMMEHVFDAQGLGASDASAELTRLVDGTDPMPPSMTKSDAEALLDALNGQ